MTRIAIPTTHTGSLPRPDRLRALLVAGAGDGATAFEEEVRRAVREVVHEQIVIGVDVMGDGEMSKPSAITYAHDRLSGFGGSPKRVVATDLVEHPRWTERSASDPLLGDLSMRCCNGRIAYRGDASVARDIVNLRDALQDVRARDAFVTAASPGLIALFCTRSADCPYTSQEAYLEAIGEALRHEYLAIVDAGFLLQIDASDLAMGRHVRSQDPGPSAFRGRAAANVAALNHATRDIPPERMRMHVCWGNYEGPHHHDIDLAQIVDILLTARPAGLSFAAANPRHEHEWAIWGEVVPPPDKILLPGVVDPTTNFIEHPDLVAERIGRFARVVGPERVVASTDCGFATLAGSSAVVPSVAWAKLRALVAGAERAGRRH